MNIYIAAKAKFIVIEKYGYLIQAGPIIKQTSGFWFYK